MAVFLLLLFLLLVFFVFFPPFSSYTLKLGTLHVKVTSGHPQSVDPFILNIHTCTNINFNQEKLRRNTSEGRLVRHDISFIDTAEKINVWASSLSFTTFSYPEMKRHRWQLIPHCSWEILAAISFRLPGLSTYTIISIKQQFQRVLKKKTCTAAFRACTYVYFFFWLMFYMYLICDLHEIRLVPWDSASGKTS